ncbi:MAG: response regulator transcription factor [Anaerolineae bacterium]|nr:response regulator transcription factor [Anaerolineae bacterium]
MMTRVLIVDDQPAFRRVLGQLLAQAGLTVSGEAGDIPEAEALVRTNPPDLAVVDVMLPGLNGLEGTSRLKALAPNLRVILVSAHLNHAGIYQDAARRAGAEAFVPKDDLDLGIVQAWKLL